jgi:hypothetical protein
MKIRSVRYLGFWILHMNINFKEDDETFLILPSFVLFDVRRLKHEKVTENNRQSTHIPFMSGDLYK